MYNQSSFTLNKLLNISSNIIDKINKFIPIYNDAKPIIKNVKNLKNFLGNSNITNIFKNEKIKSIKKNEDKLQSNLSSSNPQFFL